MVETKKPGVVAKKGKGRHPRSNPVLAPGVHRFGRSKMFHKRGVWAKKSIKKPKKVAEKKPLKVEKKIGGEKNGGKRMVQVIKSKRYHPTAVAKKRHVVQRIQLNRKLRLRTSLTPGTLCILLAGRHAGKRVVFLKQLSSGLLLVTGPFKLNGVPLRRVNQRYVIATGTKLDLSKVNVPETLNDTYFRRDKKGQRKARQQQQGDIFAAPKKEYTVSEDRKKDQVEVDKSILSVVKSHAEKKSLLRYLGSSFGLTSGQFPHRMKF